MEVGKDKACLRIRNQAYMWAFMWYNLSICFVELLFKERSSVRQIPIVTRDIINETGAHFAHMNQNWNKVIPFKKQ